MSWFPFTGTDPSDPTHYSAPVTTPPTCSNPPEQMCALQATANIDNEPIITDALKNEMLKCLQNQNNNTNVKLKSR